MGKSAGGVSIKMDTTGIDIDKVVRDLIGEDVVRTKTEYDTRKPDKYYVVKCNDVLSIYNAQLAARFFARPDTQEVQPIVDYFKDAELIFAHEHYDSGDTYSYALIYNGVLKRQFRSYCGEKTVDFGEQEESEKAWKKSVSINLNDGSTETLYKNATIDDEVEWGQLPYILLTDLMYEKLGVGDDWEDEQIVEYGFYTKQEAPAPVEAVKQPTGIPAKSVRPWWKIW